MKVRVQPQQTQIEADAQRQEPQRLQGVGQAGLEGLEHVLQRQEDHHGPHGAVGPQARVRHELDHDDHKALPEHEQRFPVAILPAGVVEGAVEVEVDFEVGLEFGIQIQIQSAPA